MPFSPKRRVRTLSGTKITLCGAVAVLAISVGAAINPAPAKAYECGVDEKDYAMNGLLPVQTETYLALASINSSYWYANYTNWVGRRRDASNTITEAHTGFVGDSFTYGTSGNVYRKTSIVGTTEDSWAWDVWEGAIC